MELKPNAPFDTSAIARLIDCPDDMHLVWPKARWPFDHEQWHQALDPTKGHLSFLVTEGGAAIGHAALRTTIRPGIYSVSYLYLRPRWRSRGKGRIVVALLERYAHQKLHVRQLDLVVRDYNPRALKCYEKCGFRRTGQEGSLIRMSKSL